MVRQTLSLRRTYKSRLNKGVEKVSPPKRQAVMPER
jgi:hypothetical protein